MLICFNAQRIPAKVIETKIQKPICLTYIEGLLFIGGANGLIKFFHAQSSEELKLNLPKAPPLGQLDDFITGQQLEGKTSTEELLYPDIVALNYDYCLKIITILYSDSLLMSHVFNPESILADNIDIKQLKKLPIFKSQETRIISQSHIGGNINSIQQLQISEETSGFVTCGHDQSIKFWKDIDSNSCLPSRVLEQQKMQPKQDGKQKKQAHAIETLSQKYKKYRFNFDFDKLPDLNVGSVMKDAVYDGNCYNKVCAISPDQKLLAIGDTCGKIRLYKISPSSNPDFKEVLIINAHNAELTCLDFSPNVFNTDESGAFRYLIASGSGDRLVHVYYIKIAGEMDSAKYQCLGVHDEHQGTVTGVKFFQEKNLNGSVGKLKIVSVSTDRQIAIRRTRAEMNSKKMFELDRIDQYQDRVLAVDVTADGGYILSAHDKNLMLQLANISQNGPNLRVQKQQKLQILWKVPIPEQSQLKISTLQQGSLFVKIFKRKLFSFSDPKSIAIYELSTGSPLIRSPIISTQSTMHCIFSNDLRYLISIATPKNTESGLIMVWKIPQVLIDAAMNQPKLAATQEQQVLAEQVIIKEQEIQQVHKSQDEEIQLINLEIPANIMPVVKMSPQVKKQKRRLYPLLKKQVYKFQNNNYYWPKQNLLNRNWKIQLQLNQRNLCPQRKGSHFPKEVMNLEIYSASHPHLPPQKNPKWL
ncbi:hypothetical protein FGO68_gene8058 [Halteria grandinella]|uniref:Uncharacterized protein n=1 Tax=Halteria grandinella TaxID=5974 RepID=A0A8J8P0V5_HALGN|nr:hypothetical protein FGO68_gene8058 [Halteria grandinella]